MTSPESPFFDIPRAEWIASNRSGFAVWDAYPVNPGHALVASRRQISDWWEATTEERADLIALVDEVRARIAEQHKPDGFNVGFNAGTAAAKPSTTCTSTSSRDTSATYQTLAVACET